MRSQRRSRVGWILAPALAAAALALPGTAGAGGGCERFCMTVEPRVGPEGSVFRFEGRGWRPRRRVVVHYGPYCRAGEACPAIAYIGRLRTNRHGAFVFRLRAGSKRPRDAERGIAAGARPSFQQRTRRGRISRAPRYRVTVPQDAR